MKATRNSKPHLVSEAPKSSMSTTCISRDAKSTTFDVRSDLIFPASEVVGNLTDFLETIGKKVDTKAAVAEVDRLRDVLDEADDATSPASTTHALKKVTTKPEQSTVFGQIDSNAADIYLAACRAETFITLCDTVLDDSDAVGSPEHMQVCALVHAAHAELELIKSTAENVNSVARCAIEGGTA